MHTNKKSNANIPSRIIGSLLCLLITLFGAALTGFIGHILIAFEYISEIFGRYILFGGIYVILTCGVFTVLIGLLGFFSFIHPNRCTSITTCVGLVILIITTTCTSVIVYMYPKTMTNLIYYRMIKTFPNYGQNMQITNAWDIMQSNLRCCAIHNRGWSDYNQTVWYKLTNADIHLHDELIPRTNLYYHFVPVSCCLTKIDGLTGFPLQIYRNKKRCQNWQYGPPTFQDGPHNDALYYRGCYNLLVDYINAYAEYILGMGLTAVILLVTVFLLLLRAELRNNPTDLQIYDTNLLKNYQNNHYYVNNK
ncbi:unnamed protein product [Schistosoma curassoni]|nr:unnamed protein product [Schistosoma curassoni]